MARRTILSFGGYGDVAISWEEQNDSKVLPVIQGLLDKRVVFFILGKKKLLGEAKKTQVTKINQAQKARHIIIPDEALEQLHSAGLITAGKVTIDSGDMDNTGEIARTAAQVAAHDTIATAPAQGG